LGSFYSRSGLRHRRRHAADFLIDRDATSSIFKSGSSQVVVMAPGLGLKNPPVGNRDIESHPSITGGNSAGLQLCAHRADGDLCDRRSLASSHLPLLRSTFHVIHPLLPPGQWLRVAVGQLHFADSWQQYPYKTGSRHVYALTSLRQETSGLPKHRASSCQRGKDMLHFGKDTLKVTFFAVTRHGVPPFFTSNASI
jgi:hypothetical protein